MRLTVEAQREKRRQSMARKAEEAALLAEEGLDEEEEGMDEEEEDGDDDKGAADEAFGAALAAEEEGGRRGGRANVKLSVGDKVLYKPLVSEWRGGTNERTNERMNEPRARCWYTRSTMTIPILPTAQEGLRGGRHRGAQVHQGGRGVPGQALRR